ncbi:MAG: hypothetical protein RL641_582 [Candidatus Parcubacteria bacterium]|jgi:hypothetical protein
MLNKKLFLGMLAFAIIALSGTAIARADNNNSGNENQEKKSSMDDWGKNDREAKEVGSTLEVHITNNGNVLVRGAKVTAINGSSLTATTTWGSSSMTWTINTDSSTKLIRRFGGTSTISEISVGDFVSFQGSLVAGTSTPMTVLAKTLKNWSVQKKNSTFEGIVTSLGGSSFIIATNNSGNITVNTTSSTQFMKNGVAGTLADITITSKITATGLYNNLTKTLDASKVAVKIPKPESMNKEGTLKTIAGTTAPTTFVLTSGGTDYTVRIATTTSVLTNNWLSASLTSFAVNHNIRVYGVVNADNTIDATVVRDTNL